MPLGWNEIRSRAVAFSKEWEGETREHAEAKTFWDEFFRVFGLNRRHLASFEEPVKKLTGSYGFIDLFWKGMLLAEHKSAGKDLGKAGSQAAEYVQFLINEGRGDEVPRYIVLSDFARIALHDLETGEEEVFPLAELYKRVDRFAFIPGYKQHSFETEDPINLKAVEIMGDLHDSLEEGGYAGHELERMLVRVLFCFFAEDTGIFERSAFQLYLENHTNEDGSDLGATLTQVFHVLNTPEETRQAGLPEELAALPYVNGELFGEFLGFPQFNQEMRECLLTCTRFDWSRISPAVFGALFQSVMEPKERRQIGAHYTSERDILKVISTLFLDELKESLDKAGKKKSELRKLHDRLASTKLLDPACGCGNFLVIAYRELRLLELEVLRRLHGGERQKILDIAELMRLDVDQMHGIEVEEWPARIAEVAMWLMDHQMNLRCSEAFGLYHRRLPLKTSPHIQIGNALEFDWNELLPASECTHVLGNPPFIGKHYLSGSQKADLRRVADGFSRVGDLDYVCGWYFKACEYTSSTGVACAFVSTNSITQGELALTFWPELMRRHSLKILFGHRTFIWKSEARGTAHVHVVIVGFGLSDRTPKYIYDYDAGNDEATRSQVSNISPYLVEGADDAVIRKHQKPMGSVPEMRCGNKPTDGGNLVLTPPEREALIEAEPEAEPYIKPFLGSRELINGIDRYCLWLRGVSPAVLRGLPEVKERVKRVREFRLASTAAPTRRAAETPADMFYVSQPSEPFIAVPEVSSSNRFYVPIARLDDSIVVSNKIYVIPTPSLFLYGVLQSHMHMAWMRQVGGRLKSDYQYSGTIVYNTFPWPSGVPEGKREAVENAASEVLNSRAEYSDSTYADLYDPLTMPRELMRAHKKLDKAVDKCYRSQPFRTERNRFEYLFDLYEKATAPLVPRKKVRRRGT